MPNYFVIENNVITNVVVSETKEIIENILNTEIMEDDGIMSIGWTRTDNNWIPPYPSDEKEYILDTSINRWVLKNPIIIEE
jgi:hypothetical protein